MNPSSSSPPPLPDLPPPPRSSAASHPDLPVTSSVVPPSPLVEVYTGDPADEVRWLREVRVTTCSFSQPSLN